MNPNLIGTVFPNLETGYVKTIQTRMSTFFQRINEQNIDILISETLEPDLIKAFFFSEYIWSGMTRNPLILKELIESKDLFTSYSSHTVKDKLNIKLKENSEPSAVKDILLQTKLYETIRTAWRDLTHAAQLEETLEDLSFLADAIVQSAVIHLYDQVSLTHGLPVDEKGNVQQLIVLGMGKLGAGELNFSSDIDLIFVYPKEGNTNGQRGISNGEFFTRLCRNFMKFFSTASHEINFYRVDTRLRPFGDGGPLVMSCLAFEEYYQAQGREWERYAMIKARPIAGDIEAGYKLLKNLNSFIYRRYFDYGSFDSFRDMKLRISLQVKNKRLKNNIKLGAGGIREIEFFGQLFQLIRGGVEPKFQERKILNVLDLLMTRRFINPSTHKELKQAYIFLRMVENRLQAYSDRQTHDIPQNEDQQTVLAQSMGYDSWMDFSTDLEKHMHRVHTHFSQLLVTEDQDQPDPDLAELKEMWANINDPQFTANPVKIGRFKKPEKVLVLLRSLESHPNTRKMTPNGRKRLARLIPGLLKKVGEQKDPDPILIKLIDLIITIERRTCYLSLLAENSSALDTLITLARKSPWIISFLSGHPALMDELLQPDTLYSPPDKAALEQEMAGRMAGISSSDYEVLLEELCVFRQVNMLRVAAADISGNYPLMKVSDHLTYIAETVLSQVLATCWEIMTKKYGLPENIEKNDIAHCGFAIVAYGKVGGFEMGYKSDIDLVFLHRGGAGLTRGKDKQVDPTTFYSNIGQRMIHALTMHTPAGTLYGADMRLRPGGSSGMIVSRIDSYKDYMENEAWTWELQALIRARPVVGDAELCSRFSRIRNQLLTQKRDPVDLKTKVCDMREKMRAHRLGSASLKDTKGKVDLKQSPGGIVDIEFLVQYLILKHAHEFPDIIKWTDNIRLLESLETHGIISAVQTQQLQKAYIAMRQAIHHLNLQEKSLEVSDDQFKENRQQVKQIYDLFLKNRS